MVLLCCSILVCIHTRFVLYQKLISLWMYWERERNAAFLMCTSKACLAVKCAKQMPQTINVNFFVWLKERNALLEEKFYIFFEWFRQLRWCFTVFGPNAPSNVFSNKIEEYLIFQRIKSAQNTWKAITIVHKREREPKSQQKSVVMSYFEGETDYGVKMKSVQKRINMLISSLKAPLLLLFN